MNPTRDNQQGESSHAPERGNAPPPAYDDSWQGDSQAAVQATDSKRSHSGVPDNAAAEGGPTVDAPFNFPPPPAYTVSASSTPSGSTSSPAGPSTAGGKGGQSNSYQYSDLPEVYNPSFEGSGGANPSSRVLLAIPQASPQPTSPFLSAYNTPMLLRRGISEDTFSSFLSTLSAFLSASVSERALSHVGDVGRSLNDIPKRLSKDTLAHAKSVGKQIGDSAKKGNIIGAGIGVIAGAITLPVAATLRVVGAVTQVPGAAVRVRPQSPRERADAYVAVAQRDWFAPRGLTATLCSTAELLLFSARYRGVGPAAGNEEAAAKNLVDRLREMDPQGQLQALDNEFGFVPVELAKKEKSLDIGTSTLWMVLMDTASET
ncbi:hypothetical protein F4808DRAFT_476079 [Astrocystis sublimbata]|nr:hypothetical protein F4808DRAFT_476079 [Astrocystis sublimbata]